MSLIDKLTTKWREKAQQKRSAPPCIETPWGDVTESARAQAAANMRDDPAKREAVIQLLAKQMGNLAEGQREALRRYPEAFTRADILAMAIDVKEAN